MSLVGGFSCWFACACQRTGPPNKQARFGTVAGTSAQRDHAAIKVSCFHLIAVPTHGNAEDWKLVSRFGLSGAATPRQSQPTGTTEDSGMSAERCARTGSVLAMQTHTRVARQR